VRRKSSFLLKKVGGESLLVPLGVEVVDLNGIITLNSTAEFVWELLAVDRSVEDLASAMVEHFDIDGVTARADLQTFLDEIAKIGILEE
jgi:hypothetical protein